MSFILNRDQEAAVTAGVDFLLNSSEQVFEIDGKAGTGKSVVLHEIVNRAGLEDYEIMPMTFTGTASNIMRLKGFTNSRSIHSWLYELVEIPKIDPETGSVMYNKKLNKPMTTFDFRPKPIGSYNPKVIKAIIIDEGYMVPYFMRETILKHGIKVIVAGDSGQLPPIGDKPAFLTGYNIHHLTELMRQSENNPIIYLADRARNGQPIHCGLYSNRVLVIEDKDLTNEMVLNVGNIICGTNYTRDNFNNTIRNLRGFSNSKFPLYGERVICRNNNWKVENCGIALANGLTGTVTSYNSIDSFDGDKFTISFLPDLISVPFENIDIDYHYINGDYKVRNNIKDDKFRFNKGELFEYAYALTTHLAQGAEYPCGIYYEEFLRSNIQNKLNYTGITRMKEYLIYVKKTRKYL